MFVYFINKYNNYLLHNIYKLFPIFKDPPFDFKVAWIQITYFVNKYMYYNT